MWMWIVVNQLKVLKLKVKQVLHLWIDNHLGQCACIATELQLHLLDMIEIDMRIAKRVHEVAHLQARHLCHHHQKQGIRRDIKWHASKYIRRALVELQ